MPKKDMGMISMTYGGIYVAQVSMGANPNQVVKAFVEAENYDGPSIILAYSHCIAHGINMMLGLEEQKKAVSSGHWPLYRFNPELRAQGKNPLQLDSKAPSTSYADFAGGENRWKVLQKSDPEASKALIDSAGKDAVKRYALLEKLAEINCDQCQQ
jgi:pyruvate-ferredoxin/flavodoxin oxidoreductase